VPVDGGRLRAPRQLHRQPAASRRSVLYQHRRRSGVITLTVWGNDITQFLQSCPDVQCVVDRAPAETAAFGSRLHGILARLRTAAPRARIVVVAAFHVQRVDIALGDQLIAAFNTTIVGVAATTRAAVADPVPAFNPAGDAGARTAALCRLTLLCTENDGHPSEAGHRVLAGLILAALHSGGGAR
jgi:lysophospholipase L1-like esterase